MSAYDSENIFAKILRGEIPCHKIHEDEKTFVFLDIMPRSHGHALVIPKAPARNILDIGEDDLAAVIATVQKIARAGMAAFEADGIMISQFNEPGGGQEVFHLHFHVIPRKTGTQLKPPASIREDDGVLAANAELLKTALSL